jgi:hypothetical protein
MSLLATKLMTNKLEVASSGKEAKAQRLCHGFQQRFD